MRWSEREVSSFVLEKKSYNLILIEGLQGSPQRPTSFPGSRSRDPGNGVVKRLLPFFAETVSCLREKSFLKCHDVYSYSGIRQI